MSALCSAANVSRKGKLRFRGLDIQAETIAGAVAEADGGIRACAQFQTVQIRYAS
jgi:hypothetical protein